VKVGTEVKVRLFAAAAEAAGVEETTVEAATLGDLEAALTARFGSELDRVLQRCSFLVNGVAATDPRTTVSAADTVDVLPPFAGG
jgi:molybdopterin synthase sulfur carrier subunit